MDSHRKPAVLLATNGGWHLPNTAKAFFDRGALAQLWTATRNKGELPAEMHKICWPTLIAGRLMGRARVPQVIRERMFYRLFFLWRNWAFRQQVPRANVVQCIMGFGREFFERPAFKDTLKVVDCPNSHPVSQYGNWQRECDLWCPGEQVPIPRWMFARMTRELRFADVVLCPSLFVKDSMIRNGIPEERCLLNPFGVDTKTFTPRSAVPERARFIVVGTICLRKGHQYLFRAFEAIRKENPTAELVCVGDYKVDFRQEQKRWHGNFIHIQHLPHAELSEELKKCTAFVMPSCEEGLARVIPEAMAAGLPIIATYESGATTLVKNGISGIIVPAAQVEPLAAAMRLLADDRALNRQMGLASYEAGARNNSWQEYGDRLLEDYARRLQGRKPAS